MAKNLYNLTEVSTVNNSDLLHVNQGSVSSDKKVTKANLLKEVNSSITSLNNSLTKCFNMSDLIGLNSSNPATIPLGSVYGAGILLFRLAQGVGPLILKFTVNNGSLSVTYMDGTAFSNPALTFSFASQALKIQSTYSGTSTLVYIVTNG